MSDTDDTDTLLLVPPNLFAVPSGSEENLETSVVEDLITHVERLETRVNTIESRTSLLGSLSGNLDPVNCNEGSSNFSFESSSIPTFQTVYPVRTVTSGKDSSVGDQQHLLGEIDRYLESIHTSSMENSFEEAAMQKESGTDKDEQRMATSGIGKNLALPDVDKLLKEMEATQNEIERKLRERENEYGIGELSIINGDIPSVRTNDRARFNYRSDVDFRADKGLGVRNDFITSRRAFILGENVGSIPDLGLGVRDMYTKTSTPRKSDEQRPVVEEPITKRDAFLVGSSSNGEDLRNSGSTLHTRSPLKGSPQRVPLNLETRKPKPFSPRRKLPFSEPAQSVMTSSIISQLPNKHDNPAERIAYHGGSGDSNDVPNEHFKIDRMPFQPKPLASHFRGNLMSLADLWKNESNLNSLDDPSKLKQKLEEEKFRRTHLEEMIQTLNKRVLEEQEKLAVAMVVDEGKDRAILQITDAWKQMVEHWKKIEADRHAMSQRLISEKASLKKARDDVDKKIERWEKEVSQALDLAAGYKNKCEFLEAELGVTKEHLEGKLKDLEEKIKINEKTITDLVEERKLLSEKLQTTQEEVEDGKRLIDSTRKEAEQIQQDLSRVEAELAVVKEQKGLIEMRLMEEKGRVVVLQQQKSSLEDKLEESRRCEAKAEEEAKNAIAELESAKLNLRDFYQNQLEMVVRSKLTEFQGQLDAAQLSMQAEIDSTKEMAQKRAEEQHNSLVNSHVTEIRRLEAIHKEELRALELKLADSERRRMKLENNHKDIAQKLHGVMENQWQQALSILTSEISLRQTNDLCSMKPDGRPERLNQCKVGKAGGSESSEEIPFNKDDLITCRSNAPRPQPSGKQEQLLKYIHMLLEKPPGKAVDSATSMFDSSMSILDMPGDLHQEPQHQPAKLATGLNDPGQSRKPPWKPQ